MLPKTMAWTLTAVPQSGNVVQAAIDLGAVVHPSCRTPRGSRPTAVRAGPAGRAAQALDDGLVFGDERAPVFRRTARCRCRSRCLPCDRPAHPRTGVVEAQHHVRIHLDEAAVAVPGEARVAGQGGKALDRLVVEAEVEHGVHHARHGDAGARADRDQQRVGGSPNFLPTARSIWPSAVGDFGAQAGGKVAALAR
jgi:hypothetical protein